MHPPKYPHQLGILHPSVSFNPPDLQMGHLCSYIYTISLVGMIGRILLLPRPHALRTLPFPTILSATSISTFPNILTSIWGLGSLQNHAGQVGLPGFSARPRCNRSGLCLGELTLRIGDEGLHACSTDFQVKECFQDKRAKELFN